MPARPQGWARRRNKKWLACWYDEAGVERSRGGFATKGDALDEAQARAEQADALRHGDLVAQRRRDLPTLGALVEEFLGQHNAEANTIRNLKDRLRHALDGPKLESEGGWCELAIDRLDPRAIGGWRKRLPARSAWAIHKALRQVLHYAVRVKLLDENVGLTVPNPEPKRQEVQTFETLARLELVADDLVTRFSAIPVFVGLTCLRPEEWIALERRDIDRKARVVHVRRVFTDGTVKAYGKQAGSLRVIPLPARASTRSTRSHRGSTRRCSSRALAAIIST
jgi:integrase